jgi:[ribosomal protein S18]-alanine N-acetyltransferase
MIRIRHAVAADLPGIMEIARHALTAAHWSQQQYEEMFSPGRLVLVLQENDQITGFVAARGVAGEWEIENIVVTGPARRRGFGSHLLGEFLHHIRGSGAREVSLEVRESNRAARALYEKWAFMEAGRRRSYYQDPPEDALILKFYFPQNS